MKSFLLTVSTPDGNVFDGACVKMDVRAAGGELAVMAGHIPMVTSVVSGDCTITLEDGTILDAQLNGGILSVDTVKTTLVAGSFSFLAEDERNQSVQ